ncbi:MAG: nucleotidyltransferase family protein, partial [Acidobacteria bacterium]|nr:nucleotidyltransferase family protein [Acidobacteriota bacterium]
MKLGAVNSKARIRFEESEVGVLATVNHDGSPHLVPITFALAGDMLVTGVDHKPKSTLSLKRLANIRHNRRVSVLVQHYAPDWSALWWARADGTATLIEPKDRRHRVAAVILPYLEDLADRGAVQKEVAAEIRRAAFSDIAVTARLRVALKEILSALHESSVDVIVLKGAALSSLIYDDQSVRPSDDIDLLCKEDSYERVWEILVKLGYETDDSPSLPHRHSQEETYFERHFYHPDGFVHVELHVDESIKTGVRPQLAASQWTRVRSIQIDGSPALMLGLEDQVVMLSVHLHRHGFNRLMWFKDIDLLIRRYADELDWGMVTGDAKA